MSDALNNALKRKEELLKELAVIEQFLALHAQFAARTNQEETKPSPQVVHRESATFPLKQRGRPADFAAIMERILLDVGRPLNRSEMVEEIENRGVGIPSEDKPRYVGTILWRYSEKFDHADDGYWLKGRDRPAKRAI